LNAIKEKCKILGSFVWRLPRSRVICDAKATGWRPILMIYQPSTSQLHHLEPHFNASPSSKFSASHVNLHT
jgi:hypothetical protein